MPEIEQMASCCGIWELNGLVQVPDENLYDLWNYSEEEEDHRNIVVFTDNSEGARKGGYGPGLFRHIRSKKLGPITFSGYRGNPNHNNETRVGIWVWFPNWKKFRAYIKTTKTYKENQELEEHYTKEQAERMARYAVTPYGTPNYQRPKW